MKILLINTFWQVRKNTQNIWSKIAGLTPPIGLMSLAACLERDGIDVDILETNAPDFSLSTLSKERLQRYDFIGLSATTNIIHHAYTIIEAIKTVLPQTKILVGGVHATILPEEVIQRPDVDFVIVGEGEPILSRFLRTDRLDTIPNLHYKNHGRIRVTFTSEETVNLNQLPMPAYHKINLSHYSLALGSYRKLPGIGMVVSRGCPSVCTYCHGPLFGHNVRMRSPAPILAEIKHLMTMYQIKEIAFYDDNFTVYKQQTLELCRAMIVERLNLSWSCFSKVTFIDEELLAVMKQAGCHQILYGIESGSPEILKNIRKHIALDRAEAVVKLTQQHGMDVRAAFMLGNPGETDATLQQTLDFAIKLNPDRAIFNITTPFPGTAMFEWARDKGYLLTTDWAEYDLSKPVMQLPTVSTETIMAYYQLAYKKFYFRWQYILRQLFLVRNWRSIFTYLKIALKLFEFLR
jgi:anaerobic magnesium-protoporphyrin IX monomethyl ester cyclase